MKILVKYPFLVLLMLVSVTLTAQSQVIGESEEIGFTIRLDMLEIPDMPPVHSYAYGVHGNDILIIGGRIDGLHARQPFAAFPLASNNQQLIVANPVQRQTWTSSLVSLPVSIRE